jgi:V-type H+-transporting ATPase subunit d
MEGLFYNVNNGYEAKVLLETEWLTIESYIEGIVRGYRNTLLTGQNYSNLIQCETIDGT